MYENVEITPKKDIVFKSLFGKKGNEGILKDFLEAILEIKIDSLQLDLSTEFLPDYYGGKKSVVDVRAKLTDGTEVNVEMQADSSKYSDKRCLEYWSRVYTHTPKAGEKKDDFKKTICIWIVDGEVFDGFTDYQSDWKIIDQKHKVYDRFNELEFHIIELPKFRKDDTIKKSKKNFWLWFIDHTNEEMVDLAYISEKEIAEARKQLDKLRSNRELMLRIIDEEMYEEDQQRALERATEEGLAKGMEEGLAKGMEEGLAKGMEEGRELGIEQGIEQGERKNKIETAKKMLETGAEINYIAQITGLTKEEIEKLKEE